MLFLIMSSYGITFFICSSKVFDYPRGFLTKAFILEEMFKCYFCTGFWVGVFQGLIRCKQFDLKALEYGFSMAAIVYMMNILIILVERLSQALDLKCLLLSLSINDEM